MWHLLQYVSEKIGGAKGTELEDDIVEMEKVKLSRYMYIYVDIYIFYVFMYLLDCVRGIVFADCAPICACFLVNGLLGQRHSQPTCCRLIVSVVNLIIETKQVSCEPGNNVMIDKCCYYILILLDLYDSHTTF